MERETKPISAREYFKKDPDWSRYIEIFFSVCCKYKISYASANEKERCFAAEIARVTFELEKAEKMLRDHGLSSEEVETKMSEAYTFE